jgi:TRAP-type mannitol/chloroaromatic compound transport system permease small subunit
MNTVYLLEKINVAVGKAVSWLTLILVLLFTYDVLTRYFFNFTKVWVTEMEWHLYALIFLLAAGYTLKEDRHVRVDLWYAKQNETRKAWVNLIGGILFLLPWCLVVIWTSFDYSAVSFHQNEGSPNPGGLPFRFIIKGAITLGFILVLLQGIAHILQSANHILKNKTDIN